MCMDKIGKIQCGGIWSSVRYPISYKKNNILLVLILTGVNNDTRQSMTSMNQHQNHHNLQRKLMLVTITWPLVGTFTFIQKNELTTSQIQLKKRQGTVSMGGLGYRPRNMLCILLHSMLNCMCCAIVYFILMFTLWIWRTIFPQGLKG